MTRDDLLAQLRDELRGLLMESFGAARSLGQWQQDGRVITQQLNRSTDLFARITHAARLPPGEIATQPAAPAAAQPKPAANGTLAQPPRKT